MGKWLIDRMADLSEWADGALWRSWVVHGLIAVPLCVLFGPLAAAVFYLLRELEQIAHQLMHFGRLAEPPRDYFFDVFFPWTVAGLWSVFSLPTLVG